jgi:hypothetical protein
MAEEVSEAVKAARAGLAILNYMASLKPEDGIDVDDQPVMAITRRALQTAIDNHPLDYDGWFDFYEHAFSYEDLLEALESVSLATINCIMEDATLAVNTS